MPDSTTAADSPSAIPKTAGFGDLLMASMMRLNEDANRGAAELGQIGRLALSQATENSGRLSAMFGVRAAQANPIEASAISSLQQAAGPGNAQANATAGMLMTLVSALANLAHVTPATQAPPTQAKPA